MLLTSLLQVAVFVALLVAVTPLLGTYMAHVFSGERTFFDPVARPIERVLYRFCRVNEKREMRWSTYLLTMLMFNLVGLVALFLILILQGVLPILNPQHVPGMRWDLAFNTAASFVSNTNWQNYAGETGVSYLSQMLGLTWQNFASAATGMAVAVALVRGITRRETKEIGNFWVDLTRAWLYILLPGSVVIAVVLLASGVIQNIAPSLVVHTLEGARQIIPMGPVASQEAIKMFGTNGGGFFNANSAHPFENPTPFTNMFEALMVLSIPASFTFLFGRFAKDARQGWVLFAAMLLLFLAGLGVMTAAERAGNPILTHAGANQTAGTTSPGGNMEGKEVRFGIAGSTIFNSATTGTSCGAVNSMLDSYTPLGGFIAMLNIQLGEIIFGGVGSGLIGMLIFALLAVFIAGLMVGRTPEYLGKKIESNEMKMAMVAVLVLAAGILGFSSVASVTQWGLAGRLNLGPHGLSEILYAYSSATGNNGSAFAGLSGNTVPYNLTLGIAMLLGRFLYLVPVLAIAGSMAVKRSAPPSAGTFPTTGGLFVGLLIGVILIVGALTFFPVYALGPIVEHFLMNIGRVF
jgi:potassium-transporting ATPase potassium-binding subunit